MDLPAAAPVDVILRDGTTLRLHPPSAADAQAVVAFFGDLSERSRYLRFHGAGSVDEKLVGTFLDPDWETRGALAATQDGRIVALASYARLRDPRAAEVAFAVADELQGRGVGTRLLERLAERAAAAGIERFVAEVLAENNAMLAVFRDAGFEIARTLERGEVEVTFPIASTETFRARVEDRDHAAVAASLLPFFEPRSVAVVGASRRRGSIGGELFRNVLDADFAGAVYPVNRSGEPVAGVRGAASVAELPEVVDLAVICVPGAQVLDAAEAALAAGVRALCVISSGFAEVGAEGRARQDELLARVRAYGGRLIGPNCLGISVPGIGLNATFAPRQLPPGRIAFSSQSGALGLALLEKAAERSLGFSAFVSIGNKADVSSNDLLEWWEDDAETDLVLLYLESFGNPRTFGRLARRVARRKPILALKAGTTSAGARAASSHTAALAGSEVAVDALFRQAGVIRARTLEELVDAASFFSTQPLPAGRRVAVLTNAGGLGILCADACDAAGLELPELAPETREALAAVLPVRGQHLESRRPARLRDRGDLRGRAAARPPRPGHRQRDRAVRAARGRERRGRRRRDRPGRRERVAGQAAARGRPERRRHAAGPRGRVAHRVLLVPGVGGADARARRRARRVAAAPARRRAAARGPRPGRGALGGRARARGRRRVARAGRRARRPRGLRDPARAGARRLDARGGRRRRARARPPRGREDRAAPASTRRSSAASRSTSRTTTTSAPPRSGSGRRCSSSRC